MNFIVG